MSEMKGSAPQSAQDEKDRGGESLCLRIKARLEEMFSDSHLAESGFLLKHIQKNKQGYVSLKLLTCLKEIKTLTTNFYVTLAAAEGSDLLEVNNESTKVRRREPLPPWLMCSPTTRFLLVRNDSDEERGGDGAVIGFQRPSLLLSVLEMFTVPSSIVSIRILHPEEELPREFRCYTKRHKELGRRVCAVVRFGSLEGVRRALRAEPKVNKKSLCVAPLRCRSMRNVTKCEPSEEKNGVQREEDTCSEGDLLETSKALVQQEPSSPSNASQEDSGIFPPQERTNCSKQGLCHENVVLCNNQSFCGLSQRLSRTNGGFGDHEWNSQSPWVLRRKFTAPTSETRHLNTPRLIQVVLRQPLGPDGTKGFHTRTRRSDSIRL